jgi:hypothetical protein
VKHRKRMGALAWPRCHRVRNLPLPAGDTIVPTWRDTDCPECLRLGKQPARPFAGSYVVVSGRAAAAPVIHVYNYGNKAICGATWSREQNCAWSNGTCRDCLQVGVTNHNRHATARYAELFGSAKPETTRYPHKCPRCSAAAYVGFTTIECSKRCA